MNDVDASRMSTRLMVAAIALAAALARIPFLTYPATIDDGGFYQVAQSWLHGGPNLYGQYWVDRPPGLIGLFAIAASSGHFVVIRVIGLVAAVVLILCVARAARLLGGSPGWAALVAASLTLTPLFNAELVPGELLAGAVTSVAFLAAVEARRTTGARALVLAAAAGLVGVAAASVKQNFLDGLVAIAVLLVADALANTGRWRRGKLLVVLAAGGGVVLGVLALLTVSLLTMPGPGALFDAVVTFRIDARSVLMDSAGERLDGRAVALWRRSLTSGLLPLAMVLLVAAVMRLRSWTAGGLAVLAGALVSVIGIVGGGGAWTHYLIGPTVWMALGAGLAAPRLLTKVAVVAVVVSCVSAVAVALGSGPTGQWQDARAIGLAIHRAAQPGDTALTLYGVADIQLYTGLTSPYEYLWSLPMAVRDPEYAELRTVVAGPTAPTWIVQTNGAVFRGEYRDTLGALVAQRYREVSDSCGSRIWLLRGQWRPIPHRFGCRPA
ncbi:MAG TPA: hypothetical protein VN088_16460 [Nocardioides sp.]|nr:hypothetical protein [Nocardioides sp.]